MVIPTLEHYLSIIQSEVALTLNKLIPPSNQSHKYIYEAARYALLGPGKRLRPSLLIATSELFHVARDYSIIPSCAFEMTHAYSLIHDDLPCMDNDDFRRGRPTVHRLYSEAIALLAGDFLLTKAFECLSFAPHISNDQKIELIQQLAYASGGEGMIGGQLLDICSSKPTLDLLHNIHSKKTGALIQSAVVCGAIIGNASLNEKTLLAQFGYELGVAFQIVDDILDVTSSIEKHGKKESSDIINQKTTYVSLLGIEAAREAASSHIKKCMEILQQFPNSFFLKAITDQVIRRID